MRPARRDRGEELVEDLDHTGAEHEDEQAGSTMKIIGNRSFTKIFWAISSAC
jgi:hypothetical protein